MDHDIFRTPNRVEPTLEERPTPPSYAHHPAGRELEETMTMWRVQTEGYTDGTDQLIGVVSRDGGFLDSPDTEWISSGVNTKSPQAVAIGRHGNFLHWGFAASPTYLTDEAKLVLVNALHYITRFDGATPVARKQAGVLVRSDIERMIHGITEEGYAETLAMYEGFRADDAERKRVLKARLDAGEELADWERRSLDSPPMADPQRLQRVRGLIADDVWATLEEDPAHVEAYLRESLAYFHPTGGWYEMAVDEELKRFGLANDEVALLQRAIEGLGGDDAQLARTLLERYTEQAFGTQAEWAAWLEQSRERLFFSEAAGYKWLVNRRKPARTGLDLRPTAEDPVALGATLDDLGDGRLALVVHARVLEGWHTYDHVPGDVPYRPMKLALELPNGLEFDGDWTRPASRGDELDPRLTVFEGEVAFRRTLIASADFDGADEVVCKVTYQVCNQQMCRRPTTQEVTATLAPEH